MLCSSFCVLLMVDLLVMSLKESSNTGTPKVPFISIIDKCILYVVHFSSSEICIMGSGGKKCERREKNVVLTKEANVIMNNEMALEKLQIVRTKLLVVLFSP